MSRRMALTSVKTRPWSAHSCLMNEAILRIRNAFPAVLRQDVDVALLYLEPRYEQPTWLASPDSIGPLLVNGEQLSIPYRVYFLEPEPDSISALTDMQRLILTVILSRSSDGFVREKCVKELLHSEEPWIPPFVLQLLGEYVLPIIRVVADHSAVLRQPEYRRFVQDNPAFVQLLRQRIISYWNCYYRGTFPRLSDYPAFQIAKSFAE